MTGKWKQNCSTTRLYWRTFSWTEGMKYCRCDGVLSVRVSTSDFIVLRRKLIIVLSVCQRWAWQKELNNYIEGTCLKVHQIAFRWTSFIPTNSLLGVLWNEVWDELHKENSFTNSCQTGPDVSHTRYLSDMTYKYNIEYHSECRQRLYSYFSIQAQL